MTASAEELILDALSWISVFVVSSTVVYLIFKRSVPLIALRAMLRRITCLFFGGASRLEKKPTLLSEIPTKLDVYAFWVRDCFTEPKPPEEPIVLKEHDTPDLPANGGHYDASGRYVLKTSKRGDPSQKEASETPHAPNSL